MKRPTAASLKKVTPENLAGLGVERLAAILAAVADTRPEVKRRLRMELAAEQGADHLAVEIDKRLATLETSRSKVSWRQRPTFVRDFDVLRALIAERFATLDPPGALSRLWRFMALVRPVGRRVRDRDGELQAVFARAAADIGGLLHQSGDSQAAALVDALVESPVAWIDFLPAVLERTSADFAEASLMLMSARPAATSGWMPLLRQLADAAGNVAAYSSTYSQAAMRTPAAAADVASRLLSVGQVDEAGSLLEGARPKPSRASRTSAAMGAVEPDFEWESVWIDYLEQSGQGQAAQVARWASFERTLSAQRARDFTRRLRDFDDVEAEAKAFDHASRHADFERGLQFLMAWPALAEAARMIQGRPDDISLSVEHAELWASQLRNRQPLAAHALLRKAAAAAFARRAFAASDRLTQEADSILPGDPHPQDRVV